MRSKHFQNKARRSFWSVHVRAWHQSGLTRTEYCRQHQLHKSTFDRWLKVLNTLESMHEDARKRRKRTREPVSGNRHNKAVQAFCAMHVEALNWSGATAKDYAAAHHISVYSLRTWRARLDADPLQVDWRARLHPSLRPTVSTSASDSAKEPQVENTLTTAPPPDPLPDASPAAASPTPRSTQSYSRPSSLAQQSRRSPVPTRSSPACCSDGAPSSDTAGRRR